MKLNVPERLILSNLLPEKGNFETMAIVESLREKLFLGEEEIEEFEVTRKGEGYSWGEKGIEEIDIDLGIKGTAFLLELLEKLDKKEELTLHQYNIYKKFKEE